MKTLTFGEKVYHVLEKVTGRQYQKLERLAIIGSKFEDGLTEDNIDDYHKFQAGIMNELIVDTKGIDNLDSEDYNALFVTCMEIYFGIMESNVKKLGDTDFLKKTQEKNLSTSW